MKPGKVLVIGDKPSRLNKNKNIAFVGAACEPRLRAWMEILGIQDYVLINRTDRFFEAWVNIAKNNYYPVIALGNIASKALNEAPHFKMPHPSGKNRKLNNKQYVTKILDECKDFLQKFLKE